MARDKFVLGAIFDHESKDNPFGPEMQFSNDSSEPTEISSKEEDAPLERKFPDPILGKDDGVTDERLDRFRMWLEEKMELLISQHEEKEVEFARYEEAYRARPPKGEFTIPFRGACKDIIPVVAMAVDPVQARLDVEIMSQDPVFTVNPLRKSLLDYKPALEAWVEFNQKHRWKLRKIAAARFFELAKLGTCVFKTTYEREEGWVRKYRRRDQGFVTVREREVRFSGPKVTGIPLSNFYFSPGYSDVQDCPIVMEKINMTKGKLRLAESSRKIANVDKVVGFPRETLGTMEMETQVQSNHVETAANLDEYTIWEIHCDYDIDDDGIPERLVVTYHKETRTFLQFRYNWYFHQKKPYVVIPYTIVDGTLYGLGLCEMVLPFQEAITRWHRMASDNAYLANTRLYVAKKNSGIEETPRIYAGRTFYVDDPSKDFRPFQAGDIYPSTMVERQNLFGMVEKRSGVSDYMTGRESPILGDRATATSTIALINEATKRVKETLENIRTGFDEIIENCFYLWIQYGTEDVEDLIFGQEQFSQQIKAFFTQMPEETINGAFSVTLKATDAGENKQARQQLQLQIIQTMMGYFQKLLEAGSQALLAIQQDQPIFAQMVADTMTAARKLFNDLLRDYNIDYPEQYTPDLARYLAGALGTSPVSGFGAENPTAGGAGGVGGQQGLPDILTAFGAAGGAIPPDPARNRGSPFLGEDSRDAFLP